MNEISHENYNFKEKLFEESKKINIILNDIQLEKLEIYKELLKNWNEKVNLTAITEDNQIIMKHFIDCLEIVKYIKKDSNVVDVGTGAGFPGLVIAIYFEKNINVTLIDSLNKRICFLEEVVNKLNLSNVKVIHARAEEFGQKNEYREKYDYAVSRAVASLNVLLEYDVPFVKLNGKCLFLKGSKLNDEIKASNKALEILKCKVNNVYEYNYISDNEEYKRNIIEIIKTSKTNNKYPRNYGKIKKNPL